MTENKIATPERIILIFIWVQCVCKAPINTCYSDAHERGQMIDL